MVNVTYGRDDVYPVKTFKVGLLHYFIAELGLAGY